MSSWACSRAPGSFAAAAAPFEETLEAYARLLQQGKVKAIGASNLTAERLAHALAVSWQDGHPHYATLQPLYNLYDRGSFEEAAVARLELDADVLHTLDAASAPT
jgi:aryl-alcohol dehydrogenase-like predicted oxidoreductase